MCSTAAVVINTAYTGSVTMDCNIVVGIQCYLLSSSGDSYASDLHGSEFPSAVRSRLPPHTEPVAVVAGQHSTPPWSQSAAGGCQTLPVDHKVRMKEGCRARGTGERAVSSNTYALHVVIQFVHYTAQLLYTQTSHDLLMHTPHVYVP